MTFLQLKQLARATIFDLKTDVLPDASSALSIGIDIVINEAIKDIAASTLCLPTSKKFNAVASQGTAINPYLISSVIGNFLCAGKGALHWNQGTVAAPQWKRLDPRTVAWLEENRPNWKEISDGSPQEYAIDGDNLYIIPAPVSSLSNALWLFYNQTPSPMSADASCPFSGTTTEMAHLSMFDMAIIYYTRWKCMPMLGKEYNQDNYSLQKNLYINEREEKKAWLKRRPDIANDSYASFKGPKIC